MPYKAQATRGNAIIIIFSLPNWPNPRTKRANHLLSMSSIIQLKKMHCLVYQKIMNHQPSVYIYVCVEIYLRTWVTYQVLHHYGIGSIQMIWVTLFLFLFLLCCVARYADVSIPGPSSWCLRIISNFSLFLLLLLSWFLSLFYDACIFCLSLNFYFFMTKSTS